MLDRLYDFSDLWTFVFFGGGAVLCYAFAHLIARLPGRTARDKDAVDFVVRAQASLFTATVLILGFSMLQVLDNYKKTQEVVARQAVQLDMLDRQMARSGDLRASELRPLLWAYAEFIMRVDWPALQAHQAQGIIVHEAIRPLARGIFALDPQPGRQMIIYNQMLNSLDALGNTRQELFRSAELRLPPEYWCLALALFLIMIGLNTMLEPVSFPVLATTAAPGLAIALFAAIVFQIDAPFQGGVAVTPTPIENVLAVMKERV